VQEHVAIDDAFLRPAEVEHLVGDADHELLKPERR
jgi:GDP-D-mannose dehydratase